MQNGFKSLSVLLRNYPVLHYLFMVVIVTLQM